MVWFRNLNPESWVPDIHISKGARVFGIGGKLGELYGTYLRVTNGALAEMYGLMFNANMIAPYRFGLNVHGPSMTGISVEVDNADLTLVAFQDGTHSFPDPTFIKEVFGNKTFILKHDKAPERVKGRDIGVVATFYRSHYSLLNAQ